MMNLMIFLGDQEQIPWSAMEYVIGQVSPRAHAASQLSAAPPSSLSLALMSWQLVQVLLTRSALAWLARDWQQPLTQESLSVTTGWAHCLATCTSLVSFLTTCPELQINYGGRVTDDLDRRCLMSVLRKYINPHVLSEDYKFVPTSGVYYSPPPGGLEQYRQGLLLQPGLQLAHLLPACTGRASRDPSPRQQT